jgi:glycosyltransferase involved in cell wall biosynthesis
MPPSLPLLSVIIPVYNVEPYLERCLESVVRQTYRNLDIILVDDGSTDAGGSICDEYQKKDRRIQVVHQGNRGLSEARNTGLALAKGDLLAFVDSDDWLELDMYAVLVNNLSVTNADIAICGFNLVTADSINAHNWPTAVLSPLKTLTLLLQDGFFTVLWNKIYKIHLFNDHIFPKGKICEDVYIMYKLFLDSHKISIINDCKYFYYYYRSNSLINSKVPKLFIDGFEASYLRHKDLKNNPSITPDILNLSGRCLIKNIMNTFYHCPFQFYKRNSEYRPIFNFFKTKRRKMREYYKLYPHGMSEFIIMYFPIFIFPVFVLIKKNISPLFRYFRLISTRVKTFLLRNMPPYMGY